MLKRSAQLSLTEQLAERFAERIRNRLLPAGARLPSVRECARQQGVSPYTVVAAYDQLLAQGLVEARPQRGFFVRHPVARPAAAPQRKARAAIESEAFSDPADARRLNAPISAATLMRCSHFQRSDPASAQRVVMMPSSAIHSRASIFSRRAAAWPPIQSMTPVQPTS